MKGTVKWYDVRKGYGFILPQGGGKDVFVHVSDVKASGLTALKDGEAVAYEVGVDDRSGKVVAKQLEVVGGSDGLAEDGR